MKFFKPQNIEQGISNIEVITSSFCGSLFYLPAIASRSGEAGGHSIFNGFAYQGDFPLAKIRLYKIQGDAFILSPFSPNYNDPDDLTVSDRFIHRNVPKQPVLRCAIPGIWPKTI